MDPFAPGAGRPQGFGGGIGGRGPLDDQGDDRLEPVERQPDGGGVAGDALDDRLQVVEQQVLEAQPLLVVEIGPGQHGADVAVEVGDGAGERLELEEHGGDRLGHAGRVVGGNLGRRHQGQRREPVGDRGQQLPGHLPGATGRGQHLLDLTMHPHTQARGRVAGRLALVLGDGGDPHLTGAGQQVAVLFEVAQPLVDDLDGQVEASVSEVVRRPLGQQGADEQPHDGDVAAGLRRRRVGVQPESLHLRRFGRHASQFGGGVRQHTTV